MGNAFMTPGIIRTLYPDAAARMSWPIRHVQLCLAIFAIFVQLTSPIAHTWHVGSEHSHRSAALDLPWQLVSSPINARAAFVAATQPRGTQHDPITCRVCQLFFHVQHALEPQPWMMAVAAITLGLSAWVRFIPCLLPHACPASRAPPRLVS